jgi:hypothetical protein
MAIDYSVFKVRQVSRESLRQAGQGSGAGDAVSLVRRAALPLDRQCELAVCRFRPRSTSLRST